MYSDAWTLRKKNYHRTKNFFFIKSTIYYNYKYEKYIFPLNWKNLGPFLVNDIQNPPHPFLAPLKKSRTFFCPKSCIMI